MNKCIVIFFILSFFGVSCRKKICNGVVVNDSIITFQILDNSGNQLIGDYWRKYDTKDVEFLNEAGQLPTGYYLSGNGYFAFNALESGQENIDSVQNHYFLHLPPTDSYPKIDIDTVKTIIFLKRQIDCRNVYLKSISVIFNDSLYYSGSNFPNPLKFIKQ